jgi:hypothetical protein
MYSGNLEIYRVLFDKLNRPNLKIIILILNTDIHTFLPL